MQKPGVTTWWQQAHLALFWAIALVVLILAGTLVLFRAGETALASRRVDLLYTNIANLEERVLLIELQIHADRRQVIAAQREQLAPRAASGERLNAPTSWLTIPEPLPAPPVQEAERNEQPPHSFGQAIVAWLRESKGITLPEIRHGR
jgi:hypothetical protein